jgi:hypothetical protein
MAVPNGTVDPIVAAIEHYKYWNQRTDELTKSFGRSARKADTCVYRTFAASCAPRFSGLPMQSWKIPPTDRMGDAIRLAAILMKYPDDDCSYSDILWEMAAPAGFTKPQIDEV